MSKGAKVFEEVSSQRIISHIVNYCENDMMDNVKAAGNDRYCLKHLLWSV